MHEILSDFLTFSRLLDLLLKFKQTIDICKWRPHSGLSALDANDPSDICASVLYSGEFMNLKNKCLKCLCRKTQS